MSKVWYEAMHRPTGRGVSQATTQTIVDADGKTKVVPVVTTVTKLGTITTHLHVAPPPAPRQRVQRERPDELKLIVEYHAAQEAQRAGPEDTRSYRDRIKDRMMTRTHDAPKADDRLPKSLIGRGWNVGTLRATVVSDDGSVCRYKYGTFGKEYAIDRAKALANITRRNLPTVSETAVTSGRVYNSKAPSGKQHITEV